MFLALIRHLDFSLPTEVWGHFNNLFAHSVQCPSDDPVYVLPSPNTKLGKENQNYKNFFINIS